MGRHRAEDCVVIVPGHGVISDGMITGGGWSWTRDDTDDDDPAPTVRQLAPRIRRARARKAKP